MSQAVSEKAYRGMGMEGFTAKWYASITHKALNDFKALAQRVAEQLPPRSFVLEVAPGPGYFAIELAKLGRYRITGIDISHTLVDIAQRNAIGAGVKVKFREGDVANMPFEDESFDFLLCRAAFKNFSQPAKALQEMYRVLRPGGRALIIDLRKDASKESVGEAVNGMGLNGVNTIMTKLIFRFVLLKRAYTRADFEQFLSQTSFKPAEITEDLTGLELSLQRPDAS